MKPIVICIGAVVEFRQIHDLDSCEPVKMGVNLKQGYNGDLTSREAGSVGGQMVKKMCSVRSAKYDRQNRIAMGHVQTVQYIAAITV